MKKRTMIAGLLGLAMWPGISHAQSCGNDSIYKIPYKDTYVKQALVAENEFRVQQPKYVTLPTFAEAKQILPNPIWAILIHSFYLHASIIIAGGIFGYLRIVETI